MSALVIVPREALEAIAFCEFERDELAGLADLSEQMSLTCVQVHQLIAVRM